VPQPGKFRITGEAPQGAPAEAPAQGA
jgi:hypothetical protein